MSMIPEELRYTEDHEWIAVTDDVFVVGITEHAQEQLGDVTYVELPEVGREVKQHEEVAVVESVKAAGDIYAPVSGCVCEVNSALEEDPSLVNSGPYTDGWFFKLENVDRTEYAQLMNAEAYAAFLESIDT